MSTSAPTIESLRADIRVRVLAPITALFVVITLAVATLTAFGGSVPPLVQVLPFAVSILLFGLPHGALDHLVPARLSGAGFVRSISLVVVLYAVLGSATAALWLIAPLLGFASFVLLTWFHWGQGDLFIDHLLGDGTTGRTGAAFTVAARGALPMLVPLAAHPTAFTAVATQTAGHFAPHAAAAIPAAAPAIAAAIVGALLLTQGAFALRRRQLSLRIGVEAVVLVAFFVVVPPVLAVGLYFTLWHSVRHILRLELIDPVAARELSKGNLFRPFARFLAQAWPITAVAVAMLIGLALIVRSADLGVYLFLLATLTTPHAVMVTWMDRRQRIWVAGRPASPRHPALIAKRPPMPTR